MKDTPSPQSVVVPGSAWARFLCRSDFMRGAAVVDGHDVSLRSFASLVEELKAAAAPAAPQAAGVEFSVDELAQEIRRVDGNHDLGAGALSEALMPFLFLRAQQPAREDAQPFGYWVDHKAANSPVFIRHGSFVPASDHYKITALYTHPAPDALRGVSARLESGDPVVGPIQYVAVRFGDVVVSAPMPGFRHHHILTVAHQLGFKTNGPSDQGFARTHEGDFLSRREAAEIAMKSGQITRLIAGPNLYSEDIW